MVASEVLKPETLRIYRFRVIAIEEVDAYFGLHGKC